VYMLAIIAALQLASSSGDYASTTATASSGDRYDQRCSKCASSPSAIPTISSAMRFARFGEEFIDSRCVLRCQRHVNVAPVTVLPVLGDFANPLAAHNDYEADERCRLITTVSARQDSAGSCHACQWMETRRD